MIYTIYPYKVVNSQGERFWYFDDELRDLKMEGLVSGTDDLLDKYAGGHEKVKLLFSNNPFDGSTIALTLVDNKVSDMTGYWYKDNTRSPSMVMSCSE